LAVTGLRRRGWGISSSSRPIRPIQTESPPAYIPAAGRSSLGKSTFKEVVVRIDAAAAGLFTVKASAEEARRNTRAMEGDFMVAIQAEVSGTS